MKKIISIIGDAKIEKDSIKHRLAYNLGKALIEAGYRVLSLRFPMLMVGSQN